MESDTAEENPEETTSKCNTIKCFPRLVCIEYPGIVNNVDKAVETLGGIAAIEIATSNAKKNLELRFQPKNYYCKPAVADKDRKPALFLKVKVRRGKIDGKIVESEVLDYDIIGISGLNFKFNKLCDFQYLPLVPPVPQEVETDLEYVYDRIIPQEIPTMEWLTGEEAQSMPFFFPPSTFAKHNSSNNQLYFDRSKFYEGRFTPEYYKKFKEQEIQQKMYRKDKGKTLSQGAFFCSFEDDIPSGPSQTCLDTLAIKYTTQSSLATINKLFEERPIWSKQALLFVSGISLEQMKYILPAVAFYFVTGPWRIMWCKFGYDPRKDPNARIYQTFDYRVKTSGFKLKVKAKRCYTKGYISNNKEVSKFSLQDELAPPKKGIEENVYILKPGMIPSARQMFYQFCDIHLPEIKAMLSRLPLALPGHPCDKKTGWLPAGFTAQCREIASKYIGAQVKKELREDKSAEEVAEVIDEKTVTPKEKDVHDEFFEISDSSTDTSDSDDDPGPTKKYDDESDNEIDLETVAEINQIIDLSMKEPKNRTGMFAQPGPSRLP